MPPALTAIDVQISRNLRQDSSLLWQRCDKSNPLKLPLDDPFHPGNATAGVAKQALNTGDLPGSSIGLGGMYRGVVVEVDVAHMLVCAVDKESEMAEIEGVGVVMDEGRVGLRAM